MHRSASRRDPPVRVRRTARGWRLSQHGTVLSEILDLPGPTHSVFDVLAAACLLADPPREIALLGLGGGGTVAALRALHCPARIHGVDLDPRGFDLLAAAHAAWPEPLVRHHGDAVDWLAHGRRRFDVILEDLSVAADGEVEKPAATWDRIPTLAARRLAPGGLAVFNLLRPPRLPWSHCLASVTRPFPHALTIELADFDNRLVLAAQTPLNARVLGRRLREHLQRLGSRQADRVSLRSHLQAPD